MGPIQKLGCQFRNQLLKLRIPPFGGIQLLHLPLFRSICSALRAAALMCSQPQVTALVPVAAIAGRVRRITSAQTCANKHHLHWSSRLFQGA
ncbi:hypothetical protein MAPG_07340 [Magnaporthiopsis poae ATCC 64411]|uniref:Uncharacterized protein n=1 Tax=Magnaporthiopsis poae (strain ATCC 64411 / 73-15) TaxID=644358 RepID=A0A0C4E4E7_MAGP6|nr:hypothetical protein MAPG_07340 [Magnaporthiopsis poae ATCC 64411]